MLARRPHRAVQANVPRLIYTYTHALCHPGPSAKLSRGRGNPLLSPTPTSATTTIGRYTSNCIPTPLILGSMAVHELVPPLLASANIVSLSLVTSSQNKACKHSVIISTGIIYTLYNVIHVHNSMHVCIYIIIHM